MESGTHLRGDSRICGVHPVYGNPRIRPDRLAQRHHVPPALRRTAQNHSFRRHPVTLVVDVGIQTPSTAQGGHGDLSGYSCICLACKSRPFSPFNECWPRECLQNASDTLIIPLLPYDWYPEIRIALMTKLRVHAFGISIDGYGAGPSQNLENPLGIGGMALHDWMFSTRTLQRMFGNEGGTTGIDDDFAARGFDNIGAWIIGRNMFGPVRGPWPDESWKGWWGDNPPFHTPVFVLTHHARASITMAGETSFHFITEGIQAALQRASAAANGKDIRIGGGVATIQEFLHAGLIDYVHLAISPVLLGSGEKLFANIDLPKLGYQCTEHSSTPKATHLVLTKRS